MECLKEGSGRDAIVNVESGRGAHVTVLRYTCP